MSRKIHLSIIALVISTISFSQITQPCTIYLKSGEVITDMRGTYNTKYFKYYKKVGDRYNKVKIELIDSVTLIEKSGSTKRLRFLPVQDEKKLQVVEQIVLGKLELYRKMISGSTYSPSYYNYYIRQKDQEKLTIVGSENMINNKKKSVLYSFLQDCPALITRIDNDEFNRIRDLSSIISIYNITCGLRKN
ncbi:hypothetical protein [Aequorivita capsosiphonis]|uniref:hypothetical protein n=1 Tax=Aequorivita capsosiphonis TaxID=487317 RepID=UPI00041D06A2|nr:hypothetical protein [Aequorivita capsosiphonis]